MKYFTFLFPISRNITLESSPRTFSHPIYCIILASGKKAGRGIFLDMLSADNMPGFKLHAIRGDTFLLLCHTVKDIDHLFSVACVRALTLLHCESLLPAEIKTRCTSILRQVVESVIDRRHMRRASRMQ